MVKRQIVQEVCNCCLERDKVERVATYSEHITVGRVKRLVNLCDEHQVELMSLMVFLELFSEEPEEPEEPDEALEDFIARVKEAPITNGKTQYGCKFCDGVFSSTGKRAKHVRDDHQGHGELKSAERIEVGGAG